MMTSREKGNGAEDLAANFLEQNGYEILDRNWYSQHYEIDIIARKNGVVAIVEVKSLASNYFREPYESVNRNKQRMIISAANAYIRRQNINDDIRFDIISIVINKNGEKIEHIENAFYPTVR
ncbi:MAG: YraN family protein [Bacteroidota bacterium]|nr:YraN family protein [Bacteroidota bacterium]